MGAVPSGMGSDLQSEKFVSIWDKNLPSCCHYCGLPSTAACKMIGEAMTFSTSLTANIQTARCPPNKAIEFPGRFIHQQAVIEWCQMWSGHW